MKRRIILEVDDEVFPRVDLSNLAVGGDRMKAEVELGLLIGPMQVDNQRTAAAALLSKWGVTLISDEQL